MTLGIVSGTIVSTINHAFYDGRKLLIVDKCDEHFAATGKYVIAIDTAGAGIGDRVLILDEGTGARQVLDDPAGPVRAVIVGVVDAIQTLSP
jgi:ethanolamine utilization protein EutN